MTATPEILAALATLDASITAITAAAVDVHTAVAGGTPPPLVTISISPATATLAAGGSQQFAATVTGSAAAVAWALSGGPGGPGSPGTLTASGLYTAPASLPQAATVTVTATVGTVSASASVSLTADVIVVPPPPGGAMVFTKAKSTTNVTGSPPNATPAGQYMTLSLHGGGSIQVGGFSANEQVGDWWEALCSGDFADPLDQKGTFFGMAVRSNAALGFTSVGVNPYEYHQNLGGGMLAYYWAGRTNGPGTPLELFQFRRLRETLRQMPGFYPQVNPKKVWMSGTSMGAWGAMQVGKHLADRIVGVFGIAPRWRYASAVGQVEVIDITAAPVNKSYPWGSGPQLSAIDGGGPCEAYFDVISYAANPANSLPVILWVTGKADQYKPFSDDIAMVAALRAAKRPFSFYWNAGGHGTPPNSGMVCGASNIPGDVIFDSYELGRGCPQYTNSSQDKDPSVDAEGGINCGFRHRNVVETATSWACEIRNVLPGTTTVKVEPCNSTVFKIPVTPKTLTLAQNVWQTVSFS